MTATADPTGGLELELRRTEAIEASGWGEKFTFIQPRNLAFWTYLALVGLGGVLYLRGVVASSAYYGPTLAVAVVVFGVYGAIFWAFTQRLDRYSSQPGKLIIAAFAYGGLVATWVMAAPANTPIRAMYSKALGAEWSLDWSAALTAPITEELAKASGLLLLIAMAPRLVKTAFDGFVLGAFLGLGFQIFEDLQYALGSAQQSFGADQIQSAMGTVYMRLIVGVGAHILYSAVFCAGLVYFLGRPAEPRRIGRGLALMLTAMLLHGFWDSGAGFGKLGIMVMGLTLIASLIAVLVTFRMTVQRERAFMHDVMAPEVATGVISPDELGALTGARRQRSGFVRSMRKEIGRRRARHVLDASWDLADELAAAKGASTPEVDFARSEVLRLRGVSASADDSDARAE